MTGGAFEFFDVAGGFFIPGAERSGVIMKNIKPSTSMSASTSVMGFERRNDRETIVTIAVATQYREV